MIDLTPPPLILPVHYEAKRPAIIRVEPYPQRHFPQLQPAEPAKAMLPGMVTTVSAPRDPYFAQVAALLHFDGANGATSFLDNSNLAATFTRTGTPAVSTAQSRFGGASGLFNGNGQFITAPSNTAYAAGTGDFTVECFCRFNVVASTDYFAHTVLDGGLAFFRTATQLGIARFWIANDLVANWSPSINTWYHIAATRQGGTARIFVDGSQIGAGTVTTNYIQGGLCVGGGKTSFASDTIDGYIDELRFTVGVARYTGNFAAPSLPFPNR